MILAFYAPFLALFWGLALDGPDVARRHLGEIALFFLGVPLLIPLGLPCCLRSTGTPSPGSA